MLLGFLGFGMAFYNHGYKNAVGTKGFIYAGNELTIMVLTVGFIMALYFFKREEYRNYLITFASFLLFSFLITSKTVLGGIIIVFLIPLMSSIRLKIKKKWLNWITAMMVLGVPLLFLTFYVGITKSGIMERIQGSLKRNEYDFLTVLLSNRNNFAKQGWEVYMNEYSLVGKIFGYGQQYHLQLSGHSAEVDFLSLLFASGISGLFFLFVILAYWGVNANNLMRINEYIYARAILIFLWFIILAANLSGHVFGSGIAGFFIGLALAMMFFNTNKLSDEEL
jgi:hypothetical protein